MKIIKVINLEKMESEHSRRRLRSALSSTYNAPLFSSDLFKESNYYRHQQRKDVPSSSITYSTPQSRINQPSLSTTRNIVNSRDTPIPMMMTDRSDLTKSKYSEKNSVASLNHQTDPIAMNFNDLHRNKRNKNKKKHFFSKLCCDCSPLCLILSLIVLLIIGMGVAALSITLSIKLLTTKITTITTQTTTTATTTRTCFTSPSLQPSNTWSFVGNMTSPRRSHTATFLAQDDSIFIAGGTSDVSVLPSTEKYLIATGCFHPMANMVRARMFHTADQLPASSGRVLLAGGSVSASILYADLYDPWTGNTTSITMSVSRRLHRSASVSGSRLVLIGGLEVNTLGVIDIFNISSSSFSTNFSNTMITPRHGHTVTPLGLNSDIFLVVGGVNIWSLLSSAELYNGSSNKFIALGSGMSTTRHSHEATYIPSVNQILLTGGSVDFNNDALNTMSVFNIATMSFISPPNTMLSKRRYHTSTLLSNGKVLLIGGQNGTTSLSSCEIIDPTNQNYSSTPVASLQTGRYYHTATLITYHGNEAVLVCGGYNNDLLTLNSCELYVV